MKQKRLFHPRTITVPRTHRFMPDGVKAGAHTITLSKPERRVLRKRKPVSCSEWATKHRVITQGPMAGSRMRLDITPHIVGQLDASFFPSVRVITVCAAPQTAKSTMVDTCMGYVMDRSPGPALSVYPDKLTAEENCDERIKPMITQSPVLAALMTSNKDDITKARIKLETMIFHMGWAGSAISLANRTIKYLDLQEVDKYKSRPNKREAGTIESAEIRVRAYPHNHKIWITSSPTDESGPVWQALISESEVIFVYWVRCPLCNGEQQMTDRQIKWPKDEDGHSIDRRIIKSKKRAWYECEHCSKKWDDYLRDQAIQTRRWRQIMDDGSKGMELFAYLAKHRPSRIGFQQPSWISSFVSLSEVAHDFLKSQDPDIDRVEQRKALRNYCNKHRSEPWTDREDERKEDQILALCDDRPQGLVPGNNQVAALFAGVDTQDNGFWYTIWAFGYGLVANMWLIKAGFLTSFSAVEEVMWQHEYKDAKGLIYPVDFCLQDSAGHRTAEVYDFCRQKPGLILPTKGERTMAQPFIYANVDYYPGTKKPFPGSLQRVRVNTTHFKDSLATKLTVAPADPGAIRLFHKTDEDFASQLCAEYRDEQGFWQQHGNRANHQWDTTVLALVAAEIRGVKYWPRPEDVEEQQQEEDEEVYRSNYVTG